MTVRFNGDDSYYSSSNSDAKITVYPIESSIIVSKASTNVNNETTIIATVQSNNTLINEGNVDFYINNSFIKRVPINNGVAILNYVPQNAGIFDIKAVFDGNRNYFPSNNVSQLFVNKSNVDLHFNNIWDVYYGELAILEVNVFSNSRKVNDGIIEFYIDNNKIGESNVKNGEAILNYYPPKTGTFKVNAIFKETNNYFKSNVSSNDIIVSKMPTTLTGESEIFDEEGYNIFTTELKDNSYNGVKGQTVKIEAIKYSGESVTFTGISDENGITVYDVSSLDGGMWYIAGTYNGNANYLGSRFSDKFIIVRVDTTTNIESTDIPYVNHVYKLKANINDENGKLVKEGVVQFYLDGVNIGFIDFSQSNSQQSSNNNDLLGAINPMFEDTLGVEDTPELYFEYTPKTAGQHVLSAVYEGTSIYKSSNQTILLNVQGGIMPTKIISSSITIAYNSGSYLVATLKDVNGNPVSGVKISVSFNGIKTLTTDKNGKIKVSTKGLAPKTYSATFTFAGNKNYAKSTKSAKVTVKKATPKLTAKKKTFKKAVKTKKYTITLKDNTGKSIKKAKVTLKIKGKKAITVKTNSKGKAIFKIKKLTRKGTYRSTVTFKANKYYNKVAKKVIIRIR